jgi:hypothetical protein
MIAIGISWIFTSAGIVNDALKFVTQKQEQINTLQKLDKRINSEAMEQQEEETTKNSVLTLRCYNSNRGIDEGKLLPLIKLVTYIYPLLLCTSSK